MAKINFKRVFSDTGTLILAGMVFGCIAGYFMKSDALVFEPLGNLFIRLIRMLVVPLVFVSIVSGAISLGATSKAGRVAAVSLTFILFTSFLAGAVAALVCAWFEPGGGMSPEIVAAFSGGEAIPSEPATMGFWDTILELIPLNPAESLVEGNILQIIFFSLLLGFGIGTVREERKQAIVKVVDGFLDALIWCIKIVMYIAPIGVFALMAPAVGTMGFDIFGKLAGLLSLDIAVVLLFGLVVYPLFVRYMSDVPLSLYMKSMIKPQAVALSTSSSLATLAVNMETCENDLKISKETTAFVLPMGATINMTGNVSKTVKSRSKQNGAGIT